MREDSKIQTFDLGEDNASDELGYRKVDNITDEIRQMYADAVASTVTKDDIFYYVYAVLHGRTYRQTYAADLKKMLPHIPPPKTRDRFDLVAEAGRKLANLHVNYDSVAPHPWRYG